MTALASLSDIVNRLTGGNSGTPQHWFQAISARVQGAAPTAPVIGTLNSLWRMDKSDGGNGGIPTSAAACNKSTVGAMPITDPDGSRQQWLLGIEGTMNVAGTWFLYDRLLHNGGLNGTTLTAQTVGGTLSRYNTNATCIGNQIWVEVYTAIGSTVTTITASYTNQNGTSGRTTKPVAIGGTGRLAQNTLIPLTLADGDTGVQAVASVTLAGTTGTAGNFGVTIARPLCMAGNMSAGAPFYRDCISGLPSVPEVLAGACLTWAYLPGSTTVATGMLVSHFIEA